MFTLKADNETYPFAIVRGGSDDGNIVFIKDQISAVKKKGVYEEPSVELSLMDGEFEQIPSSKTRCIYVAGQSGSGKSFWASRYVKNYLSIYPNAKFILFSKLNDDPVMDELRPVRLVLDESLIKSPPEMNDVPQDTIIVFDDAEALTNKKVQAVVNKFRDQLLSLGRHMNINIINISHLINQGHESRMILNESSCLVLFPRGNNVYQSSFCLTKYFGMSKPQIRDLLAIDSRWISIMKVYPSCILSEKYAVMTSKFQELK